MLIDDKQVIKAGSSPPSHFVNFLWASPHPGLLLVPSAYSAPAHEGLASLLLHLQDISQAHLALGPSAPNEEPKQLLHSGRAGREGTFPKTSVRCPHTALSGKVGRRPWWLGHSGSVLGPLC